MAVRLPRGLRQQNRALRKAFAGARGPIAPGVGGVVPPAPVAAIVLGLVSKTADGSVGQTYTGPAWSSPQWYRETLAKPKQRTAISGANERTYLATAADVGFRLVMGGVDAGTSKLAPAFAVVMPVPIVLESFDTVAKLQTSAAGNPAFTVDSANKVQGAASIIAQSQGAANRLFGELGPLTAIAGVGSVAGLGTIAWLREELEPYAMLRTSADIRLDQTTALPGTSAILAGAGAMNSHKGKVWSFARPDQSAYHQGRDPAQSWRYAFDRSASSGIPHAQRTRYDTLVAKADAQPVCVIGFDDGFVVDEALADMEAQEMFATLYVPSDEADNGNGSARYNWTQLRAVKARGHDIQCDGTTSDGSMVNTKATPAEALASLLACRNRIMSQVPGTDPRHFCYPNGHTDKFNAQPGGAIIDHRAYSGAATGTAGSANITGMTAANMGAIANGFKAGGFGVPSGTTVVAFDASAGTMTLSAPLTANLSFLAVWDDSHPFFLDKLQDAIRADGTFYTGRTGLFETWITRFGFGDRALFTPAFSMSNGATGNLSDEALADQAIARLDLAIATKTTIEFLLHSVLPGATFVQTPTPTWKKFKDALAARRDAGLVDVLTKAQLHARDGGSSFPN